MPVLPANLARPSSPERPSDPRRLEEAERFFERDDASFRASAHPGAMVFCAYLAYANSSARVAWAALAAYWLVRSFEHAMNQGSGRRFWLSTSAFVVVAMVIAIEGALAGHWGRAGMAAGALALGLVFRVGREVHASAVVLPFAAALLIDLFWGISGGSPSWPYLAALALFATLGVALLHMRAESRRRFAATLGLAAHLDSGLPSLRAGTRLGERRDLAPGGKRFSVLTASHTTELPGPIVVRREDCGPCRGLQSEDAIERRVTVAGVAVVIAYDSWSPLIEALERGALAGALAQLWALDHPSVVIGTGWIRVESVKTRRGSSEWPPMIAFANAVADLNPGPLAPYR